MLVELKTALLKYTERWDKINFILKLQDITIMIGRRINGYFFMLMVWWLLPKPRSPGILTF